MTTDHVNEMQEQVHADSSQLPEHCNRKRCFPGVSLAPVPPNLTPEQPSVSAQQESKKPSKKPRKTKDTVPAARRAPKPSPPPTLSPPMRDPVSLCYNAALEMLMGMKVESNRALEALQATKEELNGCLDPEMWAEAAQVFLAIQQEDYDEAENLKAAMQASYAQEQTRQAETAPINERSANDIYAAYSQSATLSVLLLNNYLSVELLLGGTEPSLRAVLIHWLVLEKKCLQWFPSSAHYFNICAAEIEQLKRNFEATQLSLTDEEEGVVKEDHRKGRMQLPLCTIESYLKLKTELVEGAAYAMPEEPDGAKSTPQLWEPQLFLSCRPAPSGDDTAPKEVVDLS